MDALASNILLYSILAFIITIILLFASKSYNWLPQLRISLVILSTLIPNLQISGAFDILAESLESSNLTIHMHQYSWLIGTKILFTSDPANVRHVLSKNFSNYPKGFKFKEEVDFLGDNLFVLDSEEWKPERKYVRSFTAHQNFHQTMTKVVWDRIQTGLIPVLENISKQALVVDLQGMFQKHILDIAWITAIGYNPNFLGIHFQKDPFSEAIDDACDTSFSRILMPHRLWKLFRWLGIGKEKKLKDAKETIDRIFAECISKKQLAKGIGDQEEGYNFQLHYDLTSTGVTHKSLRDDVIGLIFATQDTTSSLLAWFFWSLAKNPSVEAKIRDEILRNNFQEAKERVPQDLNKLVYLHAALCETLRLFPPAAVLPRTTIQPDTLPSGHKIDKNTDVFIAVHAMGRMTSVWGEDCHEFKPERWMTEKGEIKRVPDYQFPAFSASPRICLGKEFAFIMMKATAATIIYNFDVQMVKDHPVEPKNSIVYNMKYGLTARINNR